MIGLEMLALCVAVLVLCASMAQNCLYLFLLVVACGSMLSRPKISNARKLWASSVDQAPPLSVIVPAFNEEATIVDTVRSLMALEYPRFEVIVVNDGSTDRTMDLLDQEFDLVSRGASTSLGAERCTVHGSTKYDSLRVIDKVNRGKSDALNTGLALAGGELICAIDADSLLESDSLLRAVRPFIEYPETCVAVGGTVRVSNGCTVRRGRVRQVGLPRSYLARLQTIEYLRAFTMARLAWGQISALTIVSGAFGILRRDILLAAGGYDRHTVGEDLEVVVRLHRYMRDRSLPYRIDFVPEPVCWTQVPEDLASLARQRTRWQRGALECFERHKDMMGKRRYGAVGFFGLGSIFVLDVVTPIIEGLGYLLLPLFWIAGVVGWEFFAAYLAMTFAFGVFISVGSLILEELQLRRFPHASDIAKLTLAAIVENFGYRQLNNVWRLIGHWQYWRGEKGWGRLKRKEFLQSA